MKTLLLIPSVLKTDIEAKVAADAHPEMDYHALASGLKKTPGDTVDILDYSALEKDTSALVKLARKFGGRDAALALAGFFQRKKYDCLFTNGENVGIPLAIMLKFAPRRPGHVTIGHRLSTGKKRIFFRNLRVHMQMDTIFVYATTQLECAKTELGIPADRLTLIPFHADSNFYRPLASVKTIPNQISSAGLEWRDYPTLISAVESKPELNVRLAAASPWSKHNNETENRTLPSNVEARRYEYSELRDLYASSSIVVVPLYENDFQAGVTTILEAMAVGKPVIISQTTGQTDVIVDGVNGIAVAPGKPEELRAAIERLLQDSELRERLGANARLWIENNATLQRWVASIVGAISKSVPESVRTSGSRSSDKGTENAQSANRH